MYMTLTLTMGHVNLPIEMPRDFLHADSCNVCPICYRLRDNHLLTPQCTRFESLTLKMKVKDADGVDENRQTNVVCQLAYDCKHLRC